MIDSSAPISIREFLQTEGVEDWRVTSDGALAFFRTASFAESLELVWAIGDAIKANDHKPDIDIREDGVTVLAADQNLQFARSIADRALVMERGRLVHSATWDDLARNDPALQRLLAV